jgi:hypothetical protein
VAVIVLAGHGRLHLLLEDFDWHTLQRLEGLQMTAQQCLQILVQHITGEQEARVTQHQAEEPDSAYHARLIGEIVDEGREVDLALYAGPSLEAEPRKAWDRDRAGSPQGSASPPYRRR